MLDVSGALLIYVDGEDIAVCASGNDIVAEVRRPRKLLRQAGSLLRARRILRTVANRLNDLDLTLTISRDGTPIVMLGAKAPRASFAFLLGTEHVTFLSGKRSG